MVLLRPRRRWARAVLLAACALAGGGAAFLYGFLCSQNRLPPHRQVRSLYNWAREQPVLRAVYLPLSRRVLRGGPQGRWRARQGGEPLEQARRELLAVGYLAGSRPAGSAAGISAHDAERAAAGLNLYASGHAPEAILMDMDGKVLHRWRHVFHHAFPDHPEPASQPNLGSWRRVRVLPDGELLAIYEGFGLVKLDRDSNLLWGSSERFHHDLEVLDDGRIYTLTRDAHLLPRIHDREPILEDFITQLDADGNVLSRISVLEALEHSIYAPLLDSARPHGDILHTNTIAVLDGSLAERNQAFARGNLLISIRFLDTVAVVDPGSREVVWALTGLWARQHEPTLLPDAGLLVFDNLGNAGSSQVLELDALTQRVRWRYRADPPEGFQTATCGSAQRLANGNTLITESEAGRAFEVTPGGDIVWQFDSPHRAGAENELVATLYEVLRLPADCCSGFLSAASGSQGRRQ